MGDFTRDIAYAWRRLRSTPAFTLFATVTLALGLAVTTAIWSIVHAVMGPPPGVRDPSGLVNVYHAPSGPVPSVTMSWPDYQDLRRSQTSFESLTAWKYFRQAFAANGRAETAIGEVVGGEYFQVLGVRAAIGRTLQPADDTPSAPSVAVIAHHVWQRIFDGAPDVVGRVITMNGQSFEIVGVAPEEFRGLFNNGFAPSAMWVPIHAMALLGDTVGGYTLDPARRDRRWLLVKGRLKPGRTLEDAQAEVAVIAGRLDAAFPLGRDLDPRDGGRFERTRPWTVRWARDVVLNENASHVVRALALTLAIAVSVVLLIACTNLTNLMLARASSRAHESAVRLALGASPGRLAREALAESLILALAGGLLCLLFTRVLLSVIGSEIDFGNGIVFRVQPSMDLAVLAGAAVATLLALVVSGVAPAIQSARVDVRTALGTGGGVIARWHGRRVLIASQVMVSLVLLGVASVCLRHLEKAQRLDTGIDLDRIGVVETDLVIQRVDETRGRRVVEGVLSAVSRQPGIEAVAASSGLPLGFPTPNGWLRATDGSEPTYVEFVASTPGILRVLGVPIVAGRAFDARDAGSVDRVVVVSESAARAIFGTVAATGRHAILKRRSASGEPEMRDIDVTIVGVAADTDTFSPGSREFGSVYLPFAQQYEGRLVFTARSSADPAAAAGALRKALAAVDPQIAVSQVGVAAAIIGSENLFLQVVTGLAGVLGAFALVLALTGLYGALTHIVGRRTREIGVRVALGAEPQRIVRSVMRDGLVPVAGGIVLGAALAVVARTGMRPMFVELLPPLDPFALLAAPLLMMVAAALACYVPARRASRVDPNVALRAL